MPRSHWSGTPADNRTVRRPGGVLGSGACPARATDRPAGDTSTGTDTKDAPWCLSLTMKRRGFTNRPGTLMTSGSVSTPVNPSHPWAAASQSDCHTASRSWRVTASRSREARDCAMPRRSSSADPPLMRRWGCPCSSVSEPMNCDTTRTPMCCWSRPKTTPSRRDTCASRSRNERRFFGAEG